MPEREREELFNEAQKEKDKREREGRKAEKKRRAGAFRDLLEATSGIKVRLSEKRGEERVTWLDGV